MKVSLVSSLYRTDQHIEKWYRKISRVADILASKNIAFESVVVANDPTDKEKAVLEQLKAKSWCKLIVVDRESLYASWNRGVQAASGDICGFWNVDDVRFSKAVIDGIEQIKAGAELVYFPFIYKRYVKILNFCILAKVKIFYPPAFERSVFIKAMHCGPFFLFSKALFNRIGEFDSTYKIAGDFEWCVRAAKTGKLEKCKTIAGIFRNDGSTLSGSKNAIQQTENDKVLATHKEN